MGVGCCWLFGFWMLDVEEQKGKNQSLLTLDAER
jgi:hypothetical protein